MSNPLSLAPLFHPQSVAIIGASETSYMGSSFMKSLVRGGYRGKVFPVNVKRDQVFGMKCYRSILDIPDAVDVAAFAVPTRFVLPTFEEAVAKGIKGAVVITSGFAEVGNEGAQLQAKLRRLAETNDIPLVGPNCMGFINVRDGVFLTSGAVSEALRFGGVGAIAQSGSVFWVLASNERDVGFTYLVSIGNAAVLDSADYIGFMLEDPDVHVIVAALEGFRKPDRFLQVADIAADKGKPIVMLKVGASEQGRQAALAHTGVLAGEDAVCDAMFRQKGVIRVRDLNELLETAKLLLGAQALPQGDRVAVITVSGGEAGYLADLAQEVGLRLPNFSQSTVEALSQVVPPGCTIANPLDVAGGGLEEGDVYAESFTILANSGDTDVVIAARDMPRYRESAFTKTILAAIDGVARKTRKPCAVFTTLSGDVDEDVRAFMKARNVPLLQGARESLKAVKLLTQYARFVRCRGQALPAGSVPPVSPNQKTVQGILSGSRHALTGREGMALLREYGVPVAKDVLVRSPEEAINGAEGIGYPVALKVESRQVLHKTDAGALRLGIEDETELVLAYWEVMQNASRHDPAAVIEGVLLQEMVQNGAEVIVGLKNDPEFGPAVLFGLGGIFVELLQSFSVRLAPLSREDAEEMIAEVRGHEILLGARGRPRCDTDAVVDVIRKVAQIGLDLRDEIAEIDINPLVVFEAGAGVKAVDVLITLRDPQ